MARITISLPEELKEQLARYAQSRETSLSEAAQAALTNFLKSPPPAAPKISGQEAARIAELESYVAAMSYQVEHLRQGLAGVNGYFRKTLSQQIPCPQVMSQAPWPHSPPPGWEADYPKKFLQ